MSLDILMAKGLTEYIYYAFSKNYNEQTYFYYLINSYPFYSIDLYIDHLNEIHSFINKKEDLYPNLLSKILKKQQNILQNLFLKSI